MGENINIPLFSVITCVYNGESFISQAIQSVLDQSFSNWELIIVNDGSTDNTALVVSRFLDDTRVKYFYQNNGKQGKARNFAIAHSVAPWLAFLDADDIWLPHKLSRQLAVISSLGDSADVLFTSAERFYEENSSTKVFHCEDGYIEQGRLFTQLLSGENKILFSSVLLKKESFLVAGKFDETPLIAEDYHLWLRMCDSGFKFFGLDEVMVKYRIHKNQTSKTDFHAFILSIRAFTLVKFSTITNHKVYLVRRLNRYLIHNIDNLSADQINELLHYYLKPLNLLWNYMVSKILLLFGVNYFKRFAYRYFDL